MGWTSRQGCASSRFCAFEAIRRRMILTCPNCSTRYFTDAATLGEAGRTVRCAACGHTWHAKPEAAELAPEPAPEPDLDPDPIAAFDTPEIAAAPKPHETVRARAALRKARSRSMAAVGAWAAVAGALVVMLGAAYVFRVEMVRLFPRMASAYAAVGVEATTQGLVFRDTVDNRTYVDGRLVLNIASTVVNPTGRARPVPFVRVGVSDDAGEELYDWIVALETAELGAGEETRFTATLTNAPENARYLELRFVEDPDLGDEAPERAEDETAG